MIIRSGQKKISLALVLRTRSTRRISYANWFVRPLFRREQPLFVKLFWHDMRNWGRSLPPDADLEERIRELEALNLFTNRILLDLISLQVSSGVYNRDTVLRLIRFSADQVVAGSPHLAPLVDLYADLTAERMAPAPAKD